MKKYYNEILYKLEAEIDEIEIEAECSIHKIEAVIHLILDYLSEVKRFVLKRGFKNNDEEIHFFKSQKPVIVSKLIYYNAIYKIETKKPYGAKPIRKYLNKELKKLKRFFILSNLRLVFSAWALLPKTLPCFKSQLLGLMSSLVLKDFGVPSIVIRPITGTFPFFLGSFFFR